MKVIIFNDKDNFQGALKIINNGLPGGKKKFWDYNKYIPFIFDELKKIDGLKDISLELTNTIFYTGKYTSRLISKVNWDCKRKIEEMKNLIEQEEKLFEEINGQEIESKILEKINHHVTHMKEFLENNKEIYEGKIIKNIRNFDGQKRLFEMIDKNPSIDLRTTLLKEGDCEIYQKGIDGKIVTDLVNLAHTGAYDLALVLSGDTDLVGAIELVMGSLSKKVVVVACYDSNDKKKTNVSDLKNKCSFFMNLHDCKEGLCSVSKTLRMRNFS